MSDNKIESAPPSRIDPNSNNPDDYSIDLLIWLIKGMRTNQLKDLTSEEMKKLNKGLSEVKVMDNFRHLLVSAAEKDGTLKLNDQLKKAINDLGKPGNENLQQMLNEIGIKFKVDHHEERWSAFFQGLDAADKDIIAQKLKEHNIELKDGEEPTPEQLKEIAFKPLREQLEEIGINKDSDLTKELEKPGWMMDWHWKLEIDKRRAAKGEGFAEPFDKLVEMASLPENSTLRKLLQENELLQLDKESFSKAEKDELIEALRSRIDQQQMFNDMAFQKMTRLESEMDQTYQYLVSTVKTLHEAIVRHARGIRGAG